MRFQDSLNEVRKKERMTEGSERESERERENKSDLKIQISKLKIIQKFFFSFNPSTGQLELAVKVLGGKMCLEVTLISRNECLLVKNECEVHVFEMSLQCSQSVLSLF